MPVVNGVVVSPVGFRDAVAAALGVNIGDCGLLCNNSHGKINPYSKYKPVVHNKLSEMSEADFNAANWGYRIPKGAPLVEVVRGWKGGTKPASWAAPSGMATEIQNGWYYLSPSGGAASPYRIADFNHYWHTTPNRLTNLQVNPSAIDNNTRGIFFMINMANNYRLQDFKDIKDLHIGIAVQHDSWNSSIVKYKAVPYSITGIAFSILLLDDEVNKMLPDYGIYKVFPFLTSYKTQNLTVNSSYLYEVPDAIPFPEDYSIITKTKIEAEEYFTAEVTILTYTTSHIYVTLSVKNVSNSTRTFNAGSLTYYMSGMGSDSNIWTSDTDSLYVYETYSVPAGETKTVFTNRMYSHDAHKKLKPPYVVLFNVLYPNSFGVPKQIGSSYYQYV